MAQQTSVGDLQNNMRKLEKTLRAIRYSPEVDFAGLAKGLAGAYIPLYDYLFTSYHRNFAERLCSDGIELSGKVDAAFMKAVYKALRDIFGYKPPITVEQFFSKGYVERKVIMAAEIADIVCKHYPPPSAASLPTRPKESEVSKVARPQSAGESKARTASSLLDFGGRGVSSAKHVASTRGAAIASRHSGPRAPSAAAVSVVSRDVAFHNGSVCNGAADSAFSVAAPAAGRPAAPRLGVRATTESAHSSRPKECFVDGDVPEVRVQRERVASGSVRSALGGCVPADARIACRQPCGQPPALDALVGGDVGAKGSTVNGSAEAAAIAEIASTVLKSLESVHQRLRLMESRLDALSARVSSDAPSGEGVSTFAPSGAKQSSDLSADNVAARIVLLESRLTTLTSTVSRIMTAGVVTTGSGQTTSPSEVTSVTTPSDGDVTFGTTALAVDPMPTDRRLTSLPSGHVLSAGTMTPTPYSSSENELCDGSFTLSMPPVEQDDTAVTMLPVGGDVDNIGLSSPSSAAGTSSADDDAGVLPPLTVHDTRALTTPDRTKVNHIAQMLEGTMKMLMGK